MLPAAADAEWEWPEAAAVSANFLRASAPSQKRRTARNSGVMSSPWL